MQNHRLRKDNIRLNDEYVQFMTTVEEDATHFVVYMDESYIHNNYHQYEHSLFEPNNEQDLETKAMHKGR